MDLRTYLRVLRRRYRLISAVVLVCVGLAVLQTASAPNIYVSGSTLFVSAQDNSTSASLQSNLSGELLVQQRVKSYADILQSPRLADLVAQDLGVSTSEVNIGATVPLDTVLLKITAKNRDPKLAQRVADAAGRRFSALVAQIEKRDDGGPAPIKVSITQPALLPTKPSSPKPASNLFLGLFLGLLLGVGIAIARESLDNRVQGTEHAEQLVGAPVLGAIAFDKSAKKEPLIVHVAPTSVRAEAFRTMRTNLQFVDVDHELRSVVITSSIPGEGKSTTSCNLAISLAQAGARVILVEADLRRPKIAEYMGMEGAVGLTTVLVGGATLADALQDWGGLPLRVLTSGALPPNPSELLGSAQMDHVLRELEALADVVIIDAPPILPVTDAAVLGAVTSGVVMVVSAEKTRRDQVKRAASNVQSVGGIVLGTVFNKVPRKGVDSYGYGYGYGYYGPGNKPKPHVELATENDTEKV
ncbi:MAG: polysaccharide biosynthesis tyrosine autokinase [Actinomycetota bacterium]|nr:polysaccharide biosynthesis tyrosine autokinase [Actinomycetota bacterium]